MRSMPTADTCDGAGLAEITRVLPARALAGYPSGTGRSADLLALKAYLRGRGVTGQKARRASSCSKPSRHMLRQDIANDQGRGSRRGLSGDRIRHSAGRGWGGELVEERLARGGEAVAVVEDVRAHLGQLLATIDVQRLALFVGGAAVAFGVEQDGVVVGGREAVGLPFDDPLEGGGVAGEGAVDQADPGGARAPMGRQSVVSAAAVRAPTRRGRT